MWLNKFDKVWIIYYTDDFLNLKNMQNNWEPQGWKDNLVWFMFIYGQSILVFPNFLDFFGYDILQFH